MFILSLILTSSLTFSKIISRRKYNLIVAGSSGSFFSIADRIIQMKEHLPYDITQKAKEATKEYYPSSFSSESFPSFSTQRYPVANPELKKNDRIKIKAFDTQEVSLNYDFPNKLILPALNSNKGRYDFSINLPLTFSFLKSILSNLSI